MNVRPIDANELVKSLEDLVADIKERGDNYVLTLLPRTLIELLNDPEKVPTITCPCCGKNMDQKEDRNVKLMETIREKEAYIDRLHRNGFDATFAYEPGELVFAPAKVFDRKSTHFDFKVIDDPDRPVPARVTACVYGMKDVRYEIKALDRNLRMQGMRIVINPEHLIRADKVMKGRLANDT